MDSSQGGTSETQSSVEEAFESCVETPVDNLSTEDMEDVCFSPSYICNDLSSVFNHEDSTPVSNRELDSTEETFGCQNCDVSSDLSDEEIPSAVNQAERCHRNHNQDVRLAFQHQQVAFHLSRVDTSQLLHHLFLSTFTSLF